jgi:hypothetical protein
LITLDHDSITTATSTTADQRTLVQRRSFGIKRSLRCGELHATETRTGNRFMPPMKLERSRSGDRCYASPAYVIMALDALGYAAEHPDRLAAQFRLESMMQRTEESAVGSTAMASLAVGESGYGAGLRGAGDWLISKEVRVKGDWSVRRPNTEPSGWSPEYAGAYYPQTDLSALVLLGIGRTEFSDAAARNACTARAANWLLAMRVIASAAALAAGSVLAVSDVTSSAWAVLRGAWVAGRRAMGGSLSAHELKL